MFQISTIEIRCFLTIDYVEISVSGRSTSEWDYQLGVCFSICSGISLMSFGY